MTSEARKRSGKGVDKTEPTTVQLNFGDHAETIIVDRETFTFREEHEFAEACATMAVYRDGKVVAEPDLGQRVLAAAWVVRCRTTPEPFADLFDRLNARTGVSIVDDAEDKSPEA